MRLVGTIAFILFAVSGMAQSETEKLVTTLKEFHQAMVKKNTVSVNQQTDKALTYGHSNGWIETKKEMLANLESEYIKYEAFREDSISVEVSGNVANVRFIGDITAILNGKSGVYHLKVLEVWVKKGKRWLLFARQAVSGGGR
ncbi:MAG: nuclear transport factor 2 family protein [Chitinophagaceae bacterium]|nr:nuclear transport factor 2 family protein [Chitinophagaceae bacterium]